MKSQASNALKINRRMVLRGAGGLMLGLPLLEGFMPRGAAAQTAAAQTSTARSPFVIIIVCDNGVVQAGSTLNGSQDTEMFWPTTSGPLTQASMLADKPTRATGELSDYAERLLIVNGLQLPFPSPGCSHSGADAQILTAAQIGNTNAINLLANGISVDTAIASAVNPEGRDPLVLHAGMYSPGGTAYNIPGYVSYVTPLQERVYIDSPYKAYQLITGAVGTGTSATSAQQQAQAQRAARSKSINDLLRPQMQALLALPDLSQSDVNRLQQHFAAIRDIEVAMGTTTITLPPSDVASMQQIDQNPYDQTTHDAQIKLHLELMAFSAAADYSRVAVLKIGDREDDHVYTINGETFNYHEASHRNVANGALVCSAMDRVMMNYYKYLLDRLSSYTTPTGTLLDAGVAVYTNQIATGAHSYINVPWILCGTANGFFTKGKYVTIGSGVMPGGSQNGGGTRDPTVAVNKMHNTLLTAAGVTKSGGAPYDDFGDSSLPGGILSQLMA